MSVFVRAAGRRHTTGLSAWRSAVCSSALSGRPSPRVARASQTVSAGFSYRAVIAVESFESVPGEMAKLDAVWTVSRSTDATTKTGRTTVREQTTEKGYEALAAAHSRAVGKLSRDIADAVGALERREK